MDDVEANMNPGDPSDSGEAQDPAMAGIDRPSGADDFPVDASPEQSSPDQSDGLPVDQGESDDYSGPTLDDLVGDSRRLYVYGLRPDYDPGNVLLGESWQDEEGALHGSGMLAVMLFEPSSRDRYANASIARDLSPLAVLEKRLGRSTLFRTDLVEGENDPER